MGVSLAGVIFLTGGEALTEAKREVIEQSGAEVHPNYFISEMGTVGYGCSRMRGNCVHVFEDNVAVIAVEREAPLSGAPVQSLHFTTLLPLNPRLLINVEMDDHGVVGPASCDCVLSRLGYRTQVDGIFSFSKLTGYGATLVGSDILRVLERGLPQRFGGSPADYQLVEAESEGLGKLVLRVSPRTGAKDAAAVREFFLKEVRALFGGSLTVREWRHGDALAVVLEEPEITRAGKVLSLHLLGEGARQHAKAGRR
jgi:phenylacetate-coenzyme A ligase PaaK-like adenylate-forming protein